MISIEELANFPNVKSGDNISAIIIESILSNNIKLQNNDILCIASKVISISESRFIKLDNIIPSKLAIDIHKRVPRKDPRIIQTIIDETGDPTGKRVSVSDNYIAGWLPNGLLLTSSGVDKIDDNTVIILPQNPDASALKIGKTIFSTLGVNVGVIITDSDGRIDKKGATQVAIGLYGVPATRDTNYEDSATGIKKILSETICDMLAAAAGLVMGQRGTQKPVVRISGFNYKFNSKNNILSGINKPIFETI